MCEYTKGKGICISKMTINKITQNSTKQLKDFSKRVRKRGYKTLGLYQCN